MKLEAGRKWVEVSASDREDVDGLTQVLTKLAKADADIAHVVFTGRDNSQNGRYMVLATVADSVDVQELLRA